MPTVDGGKTRVKVPEGTETGKQFRLKGKGMPVLRSKVMGDMYIQVEVETPKNLTRRQRELLEDFERESHRRDLAAFGGLLHAGEGVLRGQGRRLTPRTASIPRAPDHGSQRPATMAA